LCLTAFVEVLDAPCLFLQDRELPSLHVQLGLGLFLDCGRGIALQHLLEQTIDGFSSRRHLLSAVVINQVKAHLSTKRSPTSAAFFGSNSVESDGGGDERATSSSTAHLVRPPGTWVERQNEQQPLRLMKTFRQLCNESPPRNPTTHKRS
jgi:hypothetical protein